MKRLAAITLLLSMLLCACGKPAGTPAPEATPSAPVSTPVPEQTPEATPTPEVTPEITPEATPDATPEPTPEATPEVTPEPTPETTPEVTPEPTPEPTPELPAGPVVDESVLLSFDGMYFEPRPQVDESAVTRFADKLNTLRSKYFADNKVYYAIIPDKSWYFRDKTDKYFDHEAICDSIGAQLEGFTAIDLSGALSGSDYYVTDPHWRQENLSSVVSVLADAMSFTYTESAYSVNNAGTFVGTYGSKAEGFAPETLYYLTSDVINAAKVDNFQQKDFTKVYDSAKFGTNGYDIFLSGATPLTVIENPNAAEKRELVIFRDSFGSSIAPLMLESYSKVTLVDLRYMVSALLPNHVNFKNADVLFLYCDELVNSSFLLK